MYTMLTSDVTSCLFVCPFCNATLIFFVHLVYRPIIKLCSSICSNAICKILIFAIISGDEPAVVKSACF